ncbi:MAG: metal-dependent hydrolase [Thermoplasmata archaeon]
MDPVSHALFPALILIALGIDRTKIVSLLPFAVIMDFDAFLGLWAHRVVFHNFIFSITLPFAAFLMVRYYHPKYLQSVYIAWFFLISHLILDLQGGFAFLWPFSEKAPYFSMEMVTNMEASGFPKVFLNIDYGYASNAPEFYGGSLITPGSFLILIIIGISLIANRKTVGAFVSNLIKDWADRLYSFFR